MIGNCPDSQTVFVDAEGVSAEASWTPPNASDNHDDTVTPYLVTGLEPGSRFTLEPDNVHTITYGAEDAAGNVAVNCEFSIIVQGDLLCTFANVQVCRDLCICSHHAHANVLVTINILTSHYVLLIADDHQSSFLF